MHIRTHLLLLPLTFLHLVPLPLQAQQPPPLPMAVNGTAPLLYVRFLGPQGMEVGIFRGRTRETWLPAPVTVGMRPGYISRVELAHLPGHPGVSLFPSIEVIGTLRLPPRIAARNFPAPVVLTEADIDTALAGGMVTKAVYLEHPEKVLAVPGDPDNPVEIPVPTTRDLLREAREVGRPVLVVRLGGRQFSPEEMARQTLPGTILLPNEKSLPLPPCPPILAPVTWLWYDPTLGPRHPEEEWIHNGGLNPYRGERNPNVTDRATRPGIDVQGHLAGVRSEDAVAEYTNSAGQRGVVLSNRVCLVVPRFGIMRQEVPLDAVNNVTGPAGQQGVTGHNLLTGGQPLLSATGKEILGGLRGRSRPSGEADTTRLIPLSRFEVLDASHIYLGPAQALGTQEMLRLSEVERTNLARRVELARALSLSVGLDSVHQVEGTSVVARVAAGPEVVKAVVETHDVTSVCLKEPVQAPDRPLVLIKWADRESAKPGDVVSFTLRYSAQGGKPLTDIAVTDSLSSRLEYVRGSAQSSRPAVFTIQENETGSQVLRWEISGKLFPHESGVVRFQARVR